MDLINSVPSIFGSIKSQDPINLFLFYLSEYNLRVGGNGRNGARHSELIQCACHLRVFVNPDNVRSPSVRTRGANDVIR